MLARTNEADEFERIDGASLELKRETIWVEIEARVRNKGTAPLRWAILNIQIPHGLHFEVTDHPEKHHYVNLQGGRSADLWPGRETRCAITVAEREFWPPHHFLYHVKVWFGQEPTEWPIVALIEGGRPYSIHKDRILIVRPARDSG